MKYSGSWEGEDSFEHIALFTDQAMFIMNKEFRFMDHSDVMSQVHLILDNYMYIKS